MMYAAVGPRAPGGRPGPPGLGAPTQTTSSLSEGGIVVVGAVSALWTTARAGNRRSRPSQTPLQTHKRVAQNRFAGESAKTTRTPRAGPDRRPGSRGGC
jgi:hypothetical protein